MKYRQVERLAEYGTASIIGQHALRQLREAVVLHVGAARRTLLFNVKRLLQLRCPVCGRRHLLPFRQTIEEKGIRIFCAYGWLRCVKLLPYLVVGALLHGED